MYLEELLENKEDSAIVRYVAKMIPEYQNTNSALIVSDYLSMMTDNYVLNDYMKRFLPVLHGEKL